MKDVIITNILALLGIMSGYFAPIQGLLNVLIVLAILDMITAIIKNIQKDKTKGFFKKLKVIKARKIVKTGFKLVAYLTFTMAVYALMIECFDDDLGFAYIVGATFGMVELTSIAENMGSATSNPVYIKIVKKIRKKIENLISDKIED